MGRELWAARALAALMVCAACTFTGLGDYPIGCSDNGMCVHQMCIGEACAGVCGTSDTQCNDNQPQTCNSMGQWEDLDIPCTGSSSPDCCTGKCTDFSEDPSNCGSCGHSCPGACSAGLCVEILTQTNGGANAGIAVDAANVYFVDSNRIEKAPLQGGAYTVLASNQGIPVQVAVDATSIYWSTMATATGGMSALTTGALMKAALDGSGLTTLASGQPDAVQYGNYPAGFAIDGASIYWTFPATGSTVSPADGGVAGVSFAPMSGVVMKAGLDGSNPVALVSNQDCPKNIAVDATSVYWTNTGNCVGGPATAPFAVMRAGLDGSNPTTMASGQAPLGTSPTNHSLLGIGIGVHGANLYWVNASGVMTVPVTGGTPTQLVPGQPSGPMAMDDTNVYWADVTGTLTVPFLGGSPTVLASPFTGGIAVGGANLYLAAGGEILATPK